MKISTVFATIALAFAAVSTTSTLAQEFLDFSTLSAADTVAQEATTDEATVSAAAAADDTATVAGEGNNNDQPIEEKKAPRCDPQALVNQLYPIAAAQEFQTCALSTGYHLIPFDGPPTMTQVLQMCTNDACLEVLKMLDKVKGSRCEVSVNRKVYVPHDLVEKAATFCGKKL